MVVLANNIGSFIMVDRCLRQTRWLSNLVRILQPLRVNHADPYLSVPCSIDSVFFTCIKTISYFIYPISYSCDKNKNIEPYPSTTDDPASLWKQEYLGHVWTCSLQRANKDDSKLAAWRHLFVETSHWPSQSHSEQLSRSCYSGGSHWDRGCRLLLGNHGLNVQRKQIDDWI